MFGWLWPSRNSTVPARNSRSSASGATPGGTAPRCRGGTSSRNAATISSESFIGIVAAVAPGFTPGEKHALNNVIALISVAIEQKLSGVARARFVLAFRWLS